MTKTTCPQIPWCEEDHSNPKTCDNFHMKHDRRNAGLAVLRADLVLDDDKPSIDIHEFLDWSIPLPQVPAFISEMRAELDRIEAMSIEFTAFMHPLERVTEPGEPDLEGRGGGL